jgi:hypothetical protein
MKARSLSTAGTVAVDMVTHSAMTENCLRAVVRTAHLETISWLCKNLGPVAKLLTKNRLLRFLGVGYRWQ